MPLCGSDALAFLMHRSVPSDMICAGLSDTGLMRSRNEDAYAIDAALGLALVCDGMGGHAGGDVASSTVARTVLDTVRTARPGWAPALGGTVAVLAAVSVIRTAVQTANRRLVVLNRESGFAPGRGMGTTLVGLWRVAGTDTLLGFHTGDSRLYRLRGGMLHALTRDHSLYQAWLDGGSKGAPPNRNIIAKALGTVADVDPDIAVHRMEPGDLYLLCSDGLNGMLADQAIAEILAREGQGDLNAAAQRLVDAANEKGGHDNITAVLARFPDP